MKSLITVATLSLTLLGAQACMAEESSAFVAFHKAQQQASQQHQAEQQAHNSKADKAARQG